MKLYKILKKDGDKYYSPFQNFQYGTADQFLGKKMVCDSFDNSQKDCSNGYYATDIQGLIYTNLSGGKVVFEMEMSGKNIQFSDYKWRWEEQTFIRIIPIEELKVLVKEQSDKMDWNYYGMLFPKNPLETNVTVTEKHKKLLKQWASVVDSVRTSVWDSVGASVKASVGASVMDPVRDSVWDSVWAYVSYGFQNIKKWKYVDHEEGVNPFQSCIDLWNDNLVPTFDGTTWRLHSGSKAEIVFEITKEDIQK